MFWRYYAFVGGWWLGSMSAALVSAEHGPASPNIVIVYTDDQAAWAHGGAVQRGWFDDVLPAHTPNMDGLAADRAAFRNFFCTTPVCGPARAAFMTGRYASEFGITDFIPHPGHQLDQPPKPVYAICDRRSPRAARPNPGND